MKGKLSHKPHKKRRKRAWRCRGGACCARRHHVSQTTHIRPAEQQSRHLSSREDLINLRGQVKIQIADSLYAVRVQINHYLVPYVEPLRMMIHGLSHQGHASHVPKRGYKILAFKRAMQF